MPILWRAVPLVLVGKTRASGSVDPLHWDSILPSGIGMIELADRVKNSLFPELLESIVWEPV